MNSDEIAFVHVQSFRLRSGEEALAARVLLKDGRVGFGFDLDMDATKARRMAEKDVMKKQDHPVLKEEPGFAALRWLP